MAKEVVWSASAQRDRQEILDYWIGRNKSKRYSVKLESLFYRATALISKHPEIGHETEMNDIRAWPVFDYSIYYRIEDQHVRILRIWDNRRDPESLSL